MPTGGNPYAIPSPIKINYTPVAPETSGLTALMAVQKAVAQQQLMAARAAAAAARASGAGGAGAKYTNYVRLPKGDGTFEMVPVVGADKDNRAAQEKELMSSRLAQLATQDKDLQESLSKMNGLSVKGQKMELDKIRQQHIPRLVKQWGISPELGAEFMKQSTASIADNINQQQKAINETGVLQTFIDSTKMGATALWDAIRSLGSTPDEKFAMGEAQSRQRQEILAQNAHLREEALRAQEGIDSWSDFFDNKTLNIAEALGDTLSGAGGIIGMQAGTQALVSGIGKGLTAIPHPAAKAAGIALQTPVARTGVALLTGGGTGAGLGGMNLANRLVAEVEAGRMTRAEAIDALEKGQLPAQLLGGGVGAAFSAMPAVNLLPKGIPMLTRSAATKRGQDYIRKQAIKASLDEGAGSALARIAGERSVQQAVADYNAPGIMAAAGRYFKAMPRTAVDLAAFNAADTLAGNVAYSQATGQPMSLDGVGQAAMAGVAGAPFFALMGTRAHYNPPRGRTFISGVEEIVPELPAAGRQYGLPEGGSAYRPKQPTPPGRSGAPWWEAAGFENEAAYRADEAHAYAEAATRRAEAMRAQNAGGASQRSSAYAPGSLWDLLQNFSAPVASDMWSDRQTPGTVWPVNAPSQPPIRRAQQSSAQPATSTPPSVPNPAASAIRPEVIAAINAVQSNAKQWGPTEISKLYRELAIGKLDPDEARTYMNALVDKKDQPKQKALAAALAQYDAISATLGRAAKNHVEAPMLKELIKNTDSLPEALEAAITLLDRQDITVKEFEDLRKTAKTRDIRRALLQTQRLFENGEISHEQVKATSGDGHEPTPTQDTASVGGGATSVVAGNGQLGKGGADTTNPPRNSGAATDSQAITPNPADQLPQSPAGGDTTNESGGDPGLSAQNTGTTEAPAGTPDVKVRSKPGNANGEPGSSPAATEPSAADTGERSAELTASAGKGGDGATEQAGANESNAIKAVERENNARTPVSLRISPEDSSDAAREKLSLQLRDSGNPAPEDTAELITRMAQTVGELDGGQTPAQVLSKVNFSFNAPLKEQVTNTLRSFEQAAWHSTPYGGIDAPIDRLSLDYMSSGEGGQLHGYGLYFMLDREGAQEFSKYRYRDRLINTEPQRAVSIAGIDIPLEDKYRSYTAVKKLTKEHPGYDIDALQRVIQLSKVYTGSDALASVQRILQNDLEFISGDILSSIRPVRDVISTQLIPFREKNRRPGFYFDDPLHKHNISDVLKDLLDNIPNGYPYEEIRRAVSAAKWAYSETAYSQDWLSETKTLLKDVDDIISSAQAVYNTAQKALRYAKNAEIKILPREVNNTGQTLLVEIPDNDKLLWKGGWDEASYTHRNAYYKDQSQYVQSAITEMKTDAPAQFKTQRSRAEKAITAVINNKLSISDFYNELADIFKAEYGSHVWAQKEASKLLASYGIDGIRYVGSTDGECAVIFTDGAIDIVDRFYNQQGRGRIDFLQDGTARILFGESADVSTPIHEFGGHFVPNELSRIANDPNIPDSPAKRQLQADITHLGEVVAGVKENLHDARMWDAEAHEKVARSFERYMYDGQAPTPELKGLFARMRALLFQLYRRAKEILGIGKLPKDVRSVFDRWLTGYEQEKNTPLAGDPVARIETEAQEAAAEEVALQKQLGVENNTENQDRAKIPIAASNEFEGDRFILPQRIKNATYEVTAPIKIKDKVSVLLNKLNNGELTPDEAIAGFYDKTAYKGGYYHSVIKGGTLSIDKAKELLKLSPDAPDGTPTLLRTITKWEKEHPVIKSSTLGSIAERIARGENVSTTEILRAAADGADLPSKTRKQTARTLPQNEGPASTAPKASPREAADTFTRSVANAELTSEVEGETKLSGKSLAEIESYINDALDAGVKPEELKKRVLFSSPHNDYNQEILDTIASISRTHKPKDAPVAAAKNVVGSGSAFKAWIENPLNMEINDKGPNFIEGPRAIFRNMNYGEAVDAASKLEWKVATEGYDKLGKREREKYNNLKMLGMPNFDKVAVNAAISDAKEKAQSEGRKVTSAEINDDAYNLFMTSREEARNKMNTDNGHNANACGV